MINLLQWIISNVAGLSAFNLYEASINTCSMLCSTTGSTGLPPVGVHSRDSTIDHRSTWWLNGQGSHIHRFHLSCSIFRWGDISENEVGWYMQYSKIPCHSSPRNHLYNVPCASANYADYFFVCSSSSYLNCDFYPYCNQCLALWVRERKKSMVWEKELDKDTCVDNRNDGR